MSKFGVPTPEQLAKINKLAKRTLSADEVFSFSGKSAGDMLIPNRYTRISPQLLQVMADDAKKSVSFMLNHNWGSFGVQGIPYGKVFDGRLEPSTENDETTGLYLDKYIVRDDEVTDGISSNALIKKIETGVLSDTSISFSTDTMVCSICGMNYFGGQCSHYRGRTYDMADGTKKLCTVTAMPPSIIIPYNNNALYEESIVWDGAYPGAIVSQSKSGDIIELPTGNFAVIQDKEELPENTLLLNKYHNGNLLTLVKKSEHKKSYSLGGIEDKSQGEINGKAIKNILKGVEKPMNEKLTKMLEVFGIECNEGKMPDDILEQLAEKWDGVTETIKASAEPLKVAEGTFSATEYLGIPIKEIKEKLGTETTADEVLNLAKEGQEYRKQLIDDTIAMGVRAMGNDFPKETYEATFATMGTKAIKDIMKTFENQAMSIPTGRQTNLDSTGKPKCSMPDEAYRV